MVPNRLAQTFQTTPLLKLNMRNVDQLFPGFASGDFAMLHGSLSVTSLASLLCVRAQLPQQLGGLGSSVVFVDGGNTFRLYQIARLAQLHKLNPKEVLNNIYISRAFTAYQITSLVMDKLSTAVKNYDAKLIVISDIAGFFLGSDVQEDEARNLFSQVTARLSRFALENQVVLIVTYPPHLETRRNLFLQALTCGRANIVISLRQTKCIREFVLEKHPQCALGAVEFSPEPFTLAYFAGVCE